MLDYDLDVTAGDVNALFDDAPAPEEQPRNRFLNLVNTMRQRGDLPPAAPADDCPNAECIQGVIPNLTTGKDEPCPDCTRRARLAQLERDLLNADIPLTELHTPWTEVNVEHESWRIVKRYCDKLPDVRARGYNAILAGLPGRGKSLGAALICRAAVEHAFTARMITAQDLINRVLRSYRDDAQESEYEIIQSLAAVDFLVIDDLDAGATKSRSVEVRILTAVIDKREKAGRCTIITTNLTAGAELEAAMGFRAFERIRYKAAQAVFDGPNERQRKHQAAVQDLDAFIMGEG